MGSAIPLYAGDHGGELPVAKNNTGVRLNPPNHGTWAVALLPYMTDLQLGNNRTENDRKIRDAADYFRCPADQTFNAACDQSWSYGWNMACGNTPEGVANTTDYPRIRMSAFTSPSKIFVVADAARSSGGYNFGNAGTDANMVAPSDSPRTHFRHPAPGRILTTAEMTSGMPRRNVLHLDGHVARRVITSDDTWRHKLKDAGLLDWDWSAHQ